MRERQSWQWQFLGFKTLEGVKPVQKWFNRLPEIVREEIADLADYLRNIVDREWKRPDFDPLDGEPCISELRPFDKIRTYRIYGCFGPGEREYTLLFGHDKAEKNDTLGKGIARTRCEQLRINHGRTHEFDFEGKPTSAIDEG